MIDREDSQARLADMIDPAKSIVPKLAIVGIAIDKNIAAVLQDLRQGYGVVVAARAGESAYAGDPLELGRCDCFRKWPDDHQHRRLEPGDRPVEGLRPLVLYVQRAGGLRYLTLQMQ